MTITTKKRPGSVMVRNTVTTFSPSTGVEVGLVPTLTGPIRVDTGTAVTVVAADGTVVCENAATVTVSMPSTLTGDDEFVIKDGAGGRDSNPITVTISGGQVFEDGTTSFVFDSDFMAIGLGFDFETQTWFYT